MRSLLARLAGASPEKAYVAQGDLAVSVEKDGVPALVPGPLTDAEVRGGGVAIALKHRQAFPASFADDHKSSPSQVEPGARKPILSVRLYCTRSTWLRMVKKHLYCWRSGGDVRKAERNFALS